MDQTSAPIFEALEKFRKMRVVPFDVPGHKRGRAIPNSLIFWGKVRFHRRKFHEPLDNPVPPRFPSSAMRKNSPPTRSARKTPF